MNLVWGIVIAIHVVSFTVMAAGLMRTFAFRKRNLFIESKYTLLFGIMKIEHVVVTYVGFTVIYAIISFLMVYYLSTL